MSNLGATFKKARETAGIPLEEIAAQTRISTRFLVAIENEAFQLLPGGIFNRGFIRAYAECLGINAEQAIADYDRISATKPEHVEVLPDTASETRSSDRYLYPVAAVILVVLVIAYYLVTRKPAEPLPDQTAPSAAAQTVPEPLPEPAAAPQSETPIKTESEAVQPSLATGGPLPLPVPARAPLSTPPSPALEPAKPAAAAALTLDVEAKNETWIQVLTDGASVFSDILQPGATRRFSGEQLIVVTIGNAAGASLKINGRDPGQLGTSGQVRQLRITPENAAQIH